MQKKCCQIDSTQVFRYKDILKGLQWRCQFMTGFLTNLYFWDLYHKT